MEVEGRVVLRPDVANARFEGSLVLSHEEFIEQKANRYKVGSGGRLSPWKSLITKDIRIR
jgi:hypothetical protein